MIERTEEVSFQEKGHIYRIKETGQILRSVSSVYREFIPEFDSQNISWMVARKQLRNELVDGWTKGDPEPSEKAIKERQEVILKEWDEKRDNSSDYGNLIHSIAEDIANGKEVDKKYKDLETKLKIEFGAYYKTLPEFLVYSKKYGVGGLIDDPQVRQRSSKSVIDIDDFKTNFEKGIQFDTIKIDDSGKLKHYNRFMLGPLSHLEDCNYNHYAMQQSIYAYLLEEMFPSHKIGKLSLTFIEVEDLEAEVWIFKLTKIPIPYMRYEAIECLEAFNRRHPFENYIEKKEEQEYDIDDF